MNRGGLATVGRVLGVELDEVGAREKLVSAVGGAVALLGVVAISHHALGLVGAPMLIASMGASAVLLFAVPHGQLSQPWPVLAGHVASALIGVSCAKAIDNTELAAACAVGLAIAAMHQFRFIHPPGGATAVSAVIGGPAVRSLGYGFVWHPVLLNALTITATAVVFNALFPWRRYPAFLSRRPPSGAVPEAVAAGGDASHDAILQAMRRLGSFVDVSEDDLRTLHQLLSEAALGAATATAPAPLAEMPSANPD